MLKHNGAKGVREISFDPLTGATHLRQGFLLCQGFGGQDGGRDGGQDGGQARPCVRRHLPAEPCCGHRQGHCCAAGVFVPSSGQGSPSYIRRRPSGSRERLPPSEERVGRRTGDSGAPHGAGPRLGLTPGKARDLRPGDSRRACSIVRLTGRPRASRSTITSRAISRVETTRAEENSSSAVSVSAK